MELTSENVNAVIKDCLFEKEEDTSKAKFVKGVMLNFGFHPDRLEKHREDVKKMLAELPVEFTESHGGGGWSFMQACVNRNGEQWGEHHTIDQLLCLGLALEEVDLVFPREMWPELPGGMPYFVVKQ